MAKTQPGKLWASWSNFHPWESHGVSSFWAHFGPAEEEGGDWDSQHRFTKGEIDLTNLTAFCDKMTRFEAERKIMDVAYLPLFPHSFFSSAIHYPSRLPTLSSRAFLLLSICTLLRTKGPRWIPDTFFQQQRWLAEQADSQRLVSPWGSEIFFFHACTQPENTWPSLTAFQLERNRVKHAWMELQCTQQRSPLSSDWSWESNVRAFLTHDQKPHWSAHQYSHGLLDATKTKQQINPCQRTFKERDKNMTTHIFFCYLLQYILAKRAGAMKLSEAELQAGFP